MPDNTRLLKAVDLFSGIPEETLRRLAPLMSARTAKPGEVVFDEDEAGDAAYFILSGRIRIEKSGMPLIRMETGECFGELALIDEGPRSASAVAETDTSLLVWSGSDFRRALTTDPSIALMVMKSLSEKLRRDVARELEATLGQARLEHEIKKARDVQMAMLPEPEYAGDGISVSGYCKPAADVGGDYYDYIDLPEGRFGIVVADVMGHGFDSGLLVAMAKSCVHTQTGIDASPGAVMSALNRVVSSSVRSGLLMSACYLVLDRRNHRLTYTNAGHPHPYHYRRAAGELKRLESTDIVLGVPGFESTMFSTVQSDWNTGDLIVLYSDGVTEAVTEDGVEYGPERLGRLVVEGYDAPASQIRDRILEDWSGRCGGSAASDDVTLVVVKAG